MLDRGLPGTPELLDPLTQSASRSENHIELVILLKATVLESATSMPQDGTLKASSRPGQTEQLNNALATGLGLYQSGQNSELKALLELIQSRFPDSPETHYNMALFKSQQGLVEQAIANLNKAESLCLQLTCDLPLLTVRAFIQARLP